MINGVFGRFNALPNLRVQIQHKSKTRYFCLQQMD